MKEDQMEKVNSVVAVFTDHQGAEAAIKKLAQDGFEMKNLSVIGKGYHTEEKVIGFYNVGDRVKFWGLRGAFWGGLWGLFFGGLFMTVPLIGNVVVLGYLASAVIAAIDNAMVVGAFSALGAAIYSIGVPKDSIVHYEEAVKADGFLVMAHGSVEEVTRAKSILTSANPSKINLHVVQKALKRMDQFAYSEHDRA
jgi:hypothetical protein